MRTLETIQLPLLRFVLPISRQSVSWDDIYLPGFIVGVLVGWLYVGLLGTIGMGVIIGMSSTDSKWLGVALLLVWLLVAFLPPRLFGELRSVWCEGQESQALGSYTGGKDQSSLE
jgi:hypothetical protein